MKEPSLKWVMIASIIGIAIFSLSFTAYKELVSYNDATISNEYLLKYKNISDYSETYENTGEIILSNGISGVLTLIKDSFLTGVNLGLGAIQSLGNTVLNLKNILNILKDDFPEYAIMISLLLTIFTIWVIYRVLSEARGTSQI